MALGLAVFYAIIYFYGGPVYASCTCNAAGRKTLPYYFLGIVVLLAYYPLYKWRKRDDQNAEEGIPPAVAADAVTTAPGGAD